MQNQVEFHSKNSHALNKELRGIKNACGNKYDIYLVKNTYLVVKD